jgi:DtxR family Mn-dependent transcriptional regulator
MGQMKQKDETPTRRPTRSEACELSESLEDYLEAILAIENEKKAARPKDIARFMSVSSPSVTAALQNLARRKLINYAPYDLVTLTDEGRRLAIDVKGRHDALLRFFAGVLRLDPDQADRIACHTEHALSAQALARLTEFMDFIDNTHRGGIRWSADEGFLGGHER